MKKYISLFVIIFFSIFLLSFQNQKVNKFSETDLPLAILIVGPQEDGTPKAIEKMEEIAVFLRDNNFNVKTFYGEKAIWKDIVDAAENANIFVYSGHGNLLGSDNSEGVLCLNSDNLIYSKQIKENLKLAENSLVLFKSVCYGAGSSASDDNDIGLNTAIDRVSNYAGLFFDCGASAYYANNLGSGVLKFLENFFAGKTFDECFVLSTKIFCDIEISEPSNLYKNYNLAIASTDWGGTSTKTTYINGVKKVEEVPNFKSYDIAYIAPKTFTFSDLKKNIK